VLVSARDHRGKGTCRERKQQHTNDHEYYAEYFLHGIISSNVAISHGQHCGDRKVHGSHVQIKWPLFKKPSSVYPVGLGLCIVAADEDPHACGDVLQDEENDEHLKDPVQAHTHPDELTDVLGEARTLLEHVMQGGQFEDLEQSLDFSDPSEPGHLRECTKLEYDIKWHDSDQVDEEPAHYIVNRDVL